MSSAVSPAPAMTAAQEGQQLADDFVIFGITGDLTKDMTSALVGDSERFTRQDGVEQCWRVMQPLLDDPAPVHLCAPGSWGPEAADEVLVRYGRRPAARRVDRDRETRQLLGLS